jgi:hypothetical protein
MASPPCNQCSTLRDQIALLRQRLAVITTGVRATVQLIDQQTETPTMPRRDLIPAVHNRLTYVLDLAEGKRVR